MQHLNARRRLIITAVAALGLASATVASPALAKPGGPPPPPPPPQPFSISFVSAGLVQHGADVNVTLSITCDDLTSVGDGYEPDATDSSGQAGGFIQVNLSQASGNTVTNGQSMQPFDPNPAHQFSPIHCDGTAQTAVVSVPVNAFNGSGTPFKLGSAVLNVFGTECGDMQQGNNNNQGPSQPQCDGFDGFNPQSGTGDPNAQGGFPNTVIRISSK